MTVSLVYIVVKGDEAKNMISSSASIKKYG